MSSAAVAERPVGAEDLPRRAFVAQIMGLPMSIHVRGPLAREAAVEWARARLEASGVPYLYVAGNHDWHYEGLPGAEAALRAEWAEKRLKPLYQGRHPLMAAADVADDGRESGGLA